MYSTDHYLVLWCLCGVTLREYQRYLGIRMRLLLCPPRQPYYEDNIFTPLHKAVPKPPDKERPNNYWIYKDTW